MKRIRVMCWFSDSEKIMADMIIVENFKCSLVKRIDPIGVISGRIEMGIEPETYYIFGKPEEINKIIEYLKRGDFDVEIEEVV